MDFSHLDADALNELVAIKRGWQRKIPPGGYTPFWYHPTARGRRLTLPKWTTDLNAAWELFAEMSQDEQFTTIGLESIGDIAQITFCDLDMCLDFVEAPTPARVICGAWCRWKEQQK